MHAEEVTQHSRLGADERPQPPRSPYETVAPMPSNLQRLKTGASGSLLESMASLTHASFSLSRGTSLARCVSPQSQVAGGCAPLQTLGWQSRPQGRG